MSAEQEAARVAVKGIADALGKALGREVVLPPQLLGVAADLVLGAVAAFGGVSLEHARLAGLARAAAVVDVTTAEAAAQERTK